MYGKGRARPEGMHRLRLRKERYAFRSGERSERGKPEVLRSYARRRSEASEENRRFYAAMPVEEEGKARETEGFAQLCPRKG